MRSVKSFICTFQGQAVILELNVASRRHVAAKRQRRLVAICGSRERHSLEGLLDHVGRIGEAAGHEAEVNIVEFEIRVNPLVFGVVDDPSQIRGNTEEEMIRRLCRVWYREYLQIRLTWTQINTDDLCCVRCRDNQGQASIQLTSHSG